MGGACMGRSIRPPQDLIGCWILNEQSRNFEVHSSPIRQSYSLNKFKQGQQKYKKLIVNSNGLINYLQSEKGNVFQIQGPIIRWGNTQIQTLNGSILRADYKKAKQGSITVQNDKLYKA